MRTDKFQKRKRIDSALVSAMKSGSTYLAEICSNHPDIFITKIKFQENEIGIDLKKYRGEKLVIARRNMKPIERDAAVYYSHNRDMKFVMMLRNPVERAFSQFAHHVRKHLKLRKPINVHKGAIDKHIYDINKDIEYKKDEYLQKEVAWVRKSEFYACVVPFLKLFPRGNIFITPLELFTEDPEKWAKDIFEFLGVPATEKSRGLNRPVNTGKYRAGFLDRVFKRKVPEFVPMTEGSKKFLTGLFIDDIKQMEALLDIDLVNIWKLDKYL